MLHPVCQTGVTVSHSFSVAGIYNVTLTVTDSSGATDTTSDAVTVGVVSNDPTASFTFSPTKTTTGVVITFNGSASSAVGSRTIVSYEWDFGDATSPVTKLTPTQTHTFTTAGTFTVTLVVTDSDGATGQTTVEVVIE